MIDDGFYEQMKDILKDEKIISFFDKNRKENKSNITKFKEYVKMMESDMTIN